MSSGGGPDSSGKSFPDRRPWDHGSAVRSQIAPRRVSGDDFRTRMRSRPPSNGSLSPNPVVFHLRKGRIRRNNRTAGPLVTLGKHDGQIGFAKATIIPSHKPVATARCGSESPRTVSAAAPLRPTVRRCISRDGATGHLGPDLNEFLTQHRQRATPDMPQDRQLPQGVGQVVGQGNNCSERHFRFVTWPVHVRVSQHPQKTSLASDLAHAGFIRCGR
jgi:hypothetical protein